MSDLKFNINTLHGLLLNNFENVIVNEKSDIQNGNYFEISIKEDKEVKIILTKKDIENTTFNWKYFSNPDLENSFLVERISTIQNIVNDIKDILLKKRFDIDYLSKFND
jgi:hypothetical protein